MASPPPVAPQDKEGQIIKTYTWEEIRKHNHEGSCWLVIEGRVYDTTEFLKRHPGGRDMMLMGAGRSGGTYLFQSSHPLWVQNPEGMLQKYYIGQAEIVTTKREAFSIQDADFTRTHLYSPSHQTDFYTVLKQRVEKYFKDNKLKPRDSTEMYVKSAIVLGVWLLLYCVLNFVQLPISVAFPLALLWGCWGANIGFSIMHDGNHGGYSNSATINRIAGTTFDFLGGSSYVWRMIHQVGHHVHTNIVERDPDIHTGNPHFRRIKPQQKFYWWYRFQVFFLPVLYSTLIFELYMRDFIAMAKGAWGGTRFQPVPLREWIIFFIAKLSYVVYNFVIPLQLQSFDRVLLVYVASNIVAGMLTVMMFQVNHVTAITKQMHVDPETNMVNEDWAISQVRGSSNFASGSWLWNHLSGGLNHQTEHHLFPTVCHVHYPAISKILRQLCKEYNLPYNNYSSFWRACLGHYELLWKMSSEGYALDLSSKMQ